MFRVLFQRVLNLRKYRIVLIALEKDDEAKIVVDIHPNNQPVPLGGVSTWGQLRRAIQHLDKSDPLHAITNLPEWQQMEMEAETFRRAETGVANILVHDPAVTLRQVEKATVTGLTGYRGVGDVSAKAIKQLFS